MDIFTRSLIQDISSFSGTITAGMNATWPDQTSLQALEAGRLWMQHHRKPAMVNGLDMKLDVKPILQKRNIDLNESI